MRVGFVWRCTTHLSQTRRLRIASTWAIARLHPSKQAISIYTLARTSCQVTRTAVFTKADTFPRPRGLPPPTQPLSRREFAVNLTPPHTNNLYSPTLDVDGPMPPYSKTPAKSCSSHYGLDCPREMLNVGCTMVGRFAFHQPSARGHY